jgi:HD-like signal output (HDOD) protein
VARLLLNRPFVKAILFVDDEPNVLNGLRNALRGRRHKWDMVFACGGEAAIAHLETRAFDVVVSDMRMPKMDGTMLLGRVKQMQPRAIRMILSGQTDPEAAMRSVFLAHRFLAKPCEPDMLEQVIDRACRLQEILQDESLRAAAGDVAMLPAAPRVFASLAGVLADPRTTLKDVTAVIEKDVGLSAKILQLVNSAFFGLPRRVSRISEAVVCLGITTVRDLALALETYAGKSTLPPERAAAVQQHSLQVAQLARQIFSQDKARAEEAFITGLLHDVGMLFPCSATAPSRELHALLGAYLLGLWGLPYPVIEAIANHNEPWRIEHQGFELVDAIYVADHLIEKASGGSTQVLDLDYLARRGVGPVELDRWRALAGSVETMREAA